MTSEQTSSVEHKADEVSIDNPMDTSADSVDATVSVVPAKRRTRLYLWAAMVLIAVMLTFFIASHRHIDYVSKNPAPKLWDKMISNEVQQAPLGVPEHLANEVKFKR
jgi:hypothetical protein